MRTDYPRCSDARTLESLPDESIVRLLDWALFRAQDGRTSLLDGNGGSVRLIGAPQHLIDRLGHTMSGTLIGIDIHVRVSQIHDTDMFSWARNNTEVFYYEPQPGKCTCGAIYDRDFPHAHSSWCSSHIYV